MGHALVEETHRRIATVIPPEMVHRGWNVKDLTLEYTDRGERWTLDFIGPNAVYVDSPFYPGMKNRAYYLRMDTGSHGTVETDSADALVDLVRQWGTTLGFTIRE